MGSGNDSGEDQPCIVTEAGNQDIEMIEKEQASAFQIDSDAGNGSGVMQDDQQA